METLEHTFQIRKYCDYLDNHIRNVERAWKIIQDKCGDVHPICDDFLWSLMDGDIRGHDLSKVSPQEFIQYQRQFFPVGERPAKDNPEFAAAWENHKKQNPHHWENWTQRKEAFPNENACYCVMMVCDWMAMGFYFGDTAQEYYENNKHKIHLPEWAERLIYEIFERVYPKSK